jgi:Arc/MetJ family transcription regulator
VLASGVATGALAVGLVFPSSVGQEAVDDLLLGEAVEDAVEHPEVEVGADLGPPS